MVREQAAQKRRQSETKQSEVKSKNIIMAGITLLLLVQANEKRRQARETDDKAEKLNQDIASGRQKIDIDQLHIRRAHSNISRSGHAIDLVHTNITSERALILSRRAEADLFQEAAGSWKNMTRLCDQLLVHGRRRELYVVEKDRQERG